MIVFLNFAPYSFGGGVERWMLDVAEELSQKEEVVLLQVDRKITDLYSKAVLGRSFISRLELSEKKNLSVKNITTAALVPFSKAYSEIQSILKKTRLIYTKLEVNELMLLQLFGGKKILEKVIIGVHSPLYYTAPPLSFFQKLHNTVYTSRLVKQVLRSSKKIHVLTEEQKDVFIKKLQITKSIKIPNYFFIDSPLPATNASKKLKVGFVGELNTRKGIDVLLQVIEKTPQDFIFTIIGDGTYKSQLLSLQKPNVIYQGYQPQKEIFASLEKMDVLMAPSRAEGFSLATLEAMSKGLVVISSAETTPADITTAVEVAENNTANEYASILEKMYEQKQTGQLQKRKKEIWRFAHDNFSKKEVIKRIKSELFEV